MRREISEENGRIVEATLRERGLTYRGADHKTGVNYNSISRMAMGYTPEMETVAKFASGLGLPVNEWLIRYGYDPLPDAEKSGSEAFLEGLTALQQELGRPLILRPKLKPGLTVEEANDLLAVIRKQAEEEDS